MQCMTSVFLFTFLTVVTAILVKRITGTDSNVPRQRFPYEYLQNYGSSWIAGPQGHHYQFHLSEQSWNIAREYCLTLASDLVVIRSLEQLMWLTAHYPPNYSTGPERTVQIGLVLTDIANSTEKEWRWVDNTPLQARYLEWEVLLAENDTEKVPPVEERGRCAVFSIDNLILRTVPCDKLPQFDYTNRFICERSEAQHHEHEKKNNPVWEIIARLISPLRNGEVIKIPDPQTLQLPEVKTQSVDVNGDLLPLISGKETITPDDSNADRLLKVQKITTKETVPVYLDAEGSGQADMDEKQAEKGGKTEDKENTAKESKQQVHQATNFSVERESKTGKSAVAENETEKNEDQLLAEAIERDFNRNSVISNDTPNQPPNQSGPRIQQSGEFCDEHVPSQPDSRTSKNEKLNDFFQNLNLFLKHAKSSDLRALLDNNQTNKTLVERLKEAANAKSNAELRRIDAKEKKKVFRNEIDDPQQFDEGTQEEHGVGDALVREIDEAINGDIFRSQDTVPDRLHDPVQSGESSGKEESLEGSRKEGKENVGRGLYEEIKEKLASKLIEHLKKQPDLDSNKTSKSAEISEEITSNTSEEYSHRNETSVQYYPAHERKPGASATEDSKNSSKEQAVGAPRTLLNNTQQTSKKTIIKLNNKFKNTLPLPDGNTILMEQSKIASNKTNIIAGIGKAVSDMEQILESAGEEIKRFFSRSRRRV